MKIKYYLLLALFLVQISLVQSQSTELQLEYSTNISNVFSTGDSPDFKIGHFMTARLVKPAFKNIDLNISANYLNTGYAFTPIGSTNPSPIDIFIDRKIALNTNIVFLGLGTSFHLNKFVITPEFGAGFITSVSIKENIVNDQGDRTWNKVVEKADKIDFNIYPFTLLIAREFKGYYTTPVVGIKGYYTLLENGEYGYYGVGLMLGLKL